MFATRINPDIVYLAFVYADSTAQRAFSLADSLRVFSSGPNRASKAENDARDKRG